MTRLQSSLAILLVLAAIGMRLWPMAQAPQAFCFSREHVHPDQAVILLMAKHILEQGEFPLFYYGQNWFGSLEAFIHAVFFLLFGLNSWTIHLAPLSLFTGFCLSLFVLAKKIFNPAVGLLALAWCVLSPVRFSEYSLMPHGGYMAAPLLGTILLLLALKSVRSTGIRSRLLSYGSLGIIGGLGWWTTPLMIYYLLAVALWVLLKERFQGVLWGFVVTIPLFFLGALPFFLFYGLDPQSQVLGMGAGYSLKNVLQGLDLFVFQRIHYFLDLHLWGDLHPGFLIYGAVIYLTGTLVFFWTFRSDLYRLFCWKHWPWISPAFLPGLLFFVFAAVLISSSHIQRNSPQYFFPLATFFPLVLGFSVLRCRGALRVGAAALLVLLFLIQGVVTWQWVGRQAPLAEARAREYLEIISQLRQRQVRHVYTGTDPGSEIINLYSGEGIISSRTMMERYPPYEEVLEREPGVAHLNTPDQPLEPTLRIIGGESTVEKLGRYRLFQNFRPPPDREYSEIPRDRLTVTASPAPQEVPTVLDRNLDTYWSHPGPGEEWAALTVDLRGFYTLGLIRIQNRPAQHGNYPLRFRLETSLDGRSWKVAHSEAPMDFYYWDGPRLYYWELGYRWECRLPARTARFIRISAVNLRPGLPWTVGELFLFEDRGPLLSAEYPLDQLRQQIEAWGLRKVYAGRWISAQIRQGPGPRPLTIRPFTEALFGRWPPSRVVEWVPDLGFVLESQDQPAFEEFLQWAGIALQKETMGRLGVYRMIHWEAQKDRLAGHHSWWWTGYGVLTVGPQVREEYRRRGLLEWR
jgi:hypothetical protein